jgi:hypothetical protein
VSIAYSDTSAREAGNSGRPNAKISRKSKEGLPQEFTLTYFDIRRDLQQGTTSYTIRTAPVRNQQNLSVPMVLTPAFADATCRFLLWRAIGNNDQIEMQLPPSEALAIESDRITVGPLPDDTYISARVTQRDRGENGLIRIIADIEDDLVFDQNEGGDYADPLNAAIDFPVSALPAVLDMPPLTSADAQQFGVYIALRVGRLDNAIAYSSWVSPDGSNWEAGPDFSQPSNWGNTTTALPEVSLDQMWDDESTVDIQLGMEGAILESLTHDEVEAGLNWAYIGGEIVGFRDATPGVAPGEYTLSGLLRARNDTKDMVEDHVVGEQFFLLPPSGSGVTFRRLEPSAYQQSLLVRMAPAGVAPTDPMAEATEVQAYPQAETLRPYSVHGLWANRRADGSICLYGTERTRIPYRVFSGLGVPFAEQGGPEEYVADVYEVQETDVFRLLRRVTACRVTNGQLSWMYSRAMMIEDLITSGVYNSETNVALITIRFEAFRLSDTIGDGRESEFCVQGGEFGPKFVSDCEVVIPE